MTKATKHQYIAQAAKLSGCSWQCYANNSADGDGGGFDRCCSSCQNIAIALAAAANTGPRQDTSDAETPAVEAEQRGYTDVDRLMDGLRQRREESQ